MRYIILAALLAASAAPQFPLSAQQLASLAPPSKRKASSPDRRVLTASRLAHSAVKVDGALDEAAWLGADVAGDFVTYEPVAGLPSSQRTEARVLYDESAVYVGIRAFDSAPDSIIGQLARRDELPHSDQVVVAIDSYFDRRTAFIFGVNPRGARMDEMMYDDASENDSWDPIWEVATAVDSLGWTAEFRIPLSQLRFSAPRGDSPQLWGLQFQRKIARNNETSFWSPMSREANGIVSFFGELHGITGLRPRRNLEVMPYSLASVTRAPRDAGNPFFHASDLRGSAGADFKYGISSNLTLSGTLNPDFGQVESDPSVVNLSAYETFLPEKRPFFVEGADIFNFGIGIGDGDLGNEALFYPRRIGRSPQGGTPDEAAFDDAPAATTILGAAKLSGKTAHGWSVGLLEAVTARETAPYITDAGVRGEAVVEPATNYTVGRVSRDFDQGQTSFGGILTATNRDLQDDELSFLRSSAYTGGVNARHRWGGGNYELSAWVVGSHVRGDTAAINRTQRSAARYFQRPDNDYATYDPLRTSLTGWAGNVQVGKMGGNWRFITLLNVKSPEFEANDMGYQQSADQLFQVWYVGYSRNKPAGPFNRYNLNVNQWNAWNFGGQRISFGGNLNGGLQLRNFWGMNAGLNHDLATWSTGSLRGGDAIRSPGSTNIWSSFYTDSRKPVRANLSLGINRENQQTGGGNWYISPYVSVRAGSQANISLGPSYSRNTEAWQYVTRKTVAGRDEYIFSQLEQTTLSLTARVNYTFTPALSLQFYAQPFVSAGDYDGFMRVRAPRDRDFDDRFQRFAPDQVSFADGRYAVDLDRNGASDLSFGNPDFNFKEMRSNAVLRWEYRPGSTLFLVWSQGRGQEDGFGSFRFSRDARDLFGAESTNVLLVKFSYWLGL